MEYLEELNYDKMITNDILDRALVNKEVYKHVYVYDLSPLEQLKPSSWFDGCILDILGFDRVELRESEDTSIDHIIIERLVEVCMNKETFEMYVKEPMLLIDELYYYCNNFYSNSRHEMGYVLPDPEIEVVKCYILMFRQLLELIVNGTLNLNKNVSAINGKDNIYRSDYNELYTVQNISMDFGKQNSYMVVYKYFTIPLLPSGVSYE